MATTAFTPRPGLLDGTGQYAGWPEEARRKEYERQYLRWLGLNPPKDSVRGETGTEFAYDLPRGTLSSNGKWVADGRGGWLPSGSLYDPSRITTAPSPEREPLHLTNEQEVALAQRVYALSVNKPITDWDAWFDDVAASNAEHYGWGFDEQQKQVLLMIAQRKYNAYLTQHPGEYALAANRARLSVLGSKVSTDAWAGWLAQQNRTPAGTDDEPNPSDAVLTHPPAPELVAPVANPPSRPGFEPSTLASVAAQETVKEIAAELAKRQNTEEEVAVFGGQAFPGYRPIKLRPRT